MAISIVCCLGGASGARADAQPAEATARTTLLPTQAPLAPSLDTSTAPTEPASPSLLHRWWFWSAVGTVAVATLAVAVLSSRGSAPPATDLGSQGLGP